MSKVSNLLKKYWLTDRNGKLCQSVRLDGADLIDTHQQVVDTPLLPCFADKSVSYAKRLGMIEIDHLAFTLQSSAFQKMRTSDGWAQLPDLKTFPETLEGYDSFVECVLETEHIRLEQFVRRVLGLRLGSSRNFGRFFYTHSYPLLDPKSKRSIGFVAFGGNNNTLYFQISGTGCKYVFCHTNKYRLHHWLKFFGVDELTRIDLFFDDFDGNFTPEHALLAYKDLAFNRFKGGRTPKAEPHYLYENGEQVCLDIIRVGSRTSDFFWRCYNKGLQQEYDKPWFRSEVEIKRCSVDVLLNTANFFASICPYSSSMNIEKVSDFDLVRRQKVKALASLKKKTEWIRRMCGKAIYDLVEDWGLSAEESLIMMIGADSDGNCKHGGAVSAPPIFSDLVRVNYV